MCDEQDSREELITSEGFRAVENWGGPKGEKLEGYCLDVHFFPGCQGTKAQAQDGKCEEEEVGGTVGPAGGIWSLSVVLMPQAAHEVSPVYLEKRVVFGLGAGSLSSFLTGSEAKSVFQVQGRSRIKRSWRRVKKAAG